MFSEWVGMKLAYKTDKFVNDPKGDIGTQYNHLVWVCYNVGKKLGLSYWTRDRLGILVHGDASLGFIVHYLLTEKLRKHLFLV